MRRIEIAALAVGSAVLVWCLSFGLSSGQIAADDKESADNDYGSIAGQFVLEGEIPPRRVLVQAGAVVNDAGICAATDVLSDELVIEPKTKGIADVFVYLPKAEKVHPRLKHSAVKEIVFDQAGCRFVPHALFVRTDQVVRVKSGDNCAHNTKTNPLKNQPVNFGLTPNDRAGVAVKNPLPERLPVEVQCNIHGWMSARWLILDHPYAAISDENGKFTLNDLPAGEHELALWQERAGYIVKKYKVTVAGGKTTDLGTIKVPVAKFTDKN